MLCSWCGHPSICSCHFSLPQINLDVRASLTTILGVVLSMLRQINTSHGMANLLNWSQKAVTVSIILACIWILGSSLIAPLCLTTVKRNCRAFHTHTLTHHTHAHSLSHFHTTNSPYCII